MKGLHRFILAAAAGLLTAFQAQAAAIVLFEYAFNIDGTVTTDAAPAGVNLGGFDTLTGLTGLGGPITVTLSGAGSHYVGLFVDHEIDEATNTFFNEVGSPTGGAAAGQTWEIDEPDYVFGNIVANFDAETLDNSNGVPSAAPDDVSMAMAWDFVLAADEIATISFRVTDTLPTGGFYLTHTDPDSQASIYLTSSLNIRQGGGDIPEPGTVALLGLGLLGASLARRRPASS